MDELEQRDKLFPNKLSIITICYNERNLRATCDSIVNQKWQDFEWIVIDGGSKQEVLNVFNDYKYRIDHFVSEHDNGRYNAMNKGINLAKGEYINFLNAGDCYNDNNVLDNVVKQGLDRDVIYGDLNFVKDGKVKHIKYPDKISMEYLYTESLPHPASFIKRKLFLCYGFYDEKYKIVSDWKKWLEFFVLNGCTYKHIKHICVKFNLNGISGTNSQLSAKEREDVLYNLFTASQLQDLKYRAATNTGELSLKEKIFSLKNTYDKKHKVITFMGLKIIIKRRVS